MNCKMHPSKEAVAVCSKCGSGICSTCSRISKDYNGLCPSCAKKGLTSEKEWLNSLCAKFKKRIIVLSILYVLGIILFLVGFFAFKGDMDGIILFCGLGIVMIGLYPAILGWKKGKEMHEKSEQLFGKTYTVSSSGISKDNGTLEKALSALIHLVLGVIMTPWEIISMSGKIKSMKSDIVAIDNEFKRIDNLINGAV